MHGRRDRHRGHRRSLSRKKGTSRKLLQDIGKNAAVTQERALERGVNAHDAVERDARAVRTRGRHGRAGTGGQPGSKVNGFDIVDLRPIQAKCRGPAALGELEGKDAHLDEVGPVDPLEALGDDGAHAQEQRPLCRPIPA